MFKSLVIFIPQIFRHRFVHKQIFNMENAYFRHVTDTNQLDISFRYANQDLGIDRRFNFSRQITENLDDCLHRININLEKAFVKKSKRKKKDAVVPTASVEVDVKIFQNGKMVCGDRTCKEILQDPIDLSFKILDKEYRIIYNAPWIHHLQLPTSLLSSFPVYPSKLDMQFTDKKQCVFTWYKGKLIKPIDVHNKTELYEWVEVGNEFIYTPTNDDIGYQLRLVCEPRSNDMIGPCSEEISSTKVEAGPGYCPFEFRHEFTKEKLLGNNFRVCSYNILADLYCDSEYSRTELYPYCPPYALNIDYRKQLFLKELLGYNFDVACLQEVDGHVFDMDLTPVLTSVGYSGCYKKKGGSVAEGLAIFYNDKKFKLLEKHGIILGEQVKILPIFSDLWKKIENNLPLVERLCERQTAAQTLVLECLLTGKILIVANTHLYFHPDADHIRLLQLGFASLWINNIIMETKLKLSNKKISLIFCGDFNSVPECGIFMLMTKKLVPDNIIDWSSNAVEAVKGVTLSQPIEMDSACGTPQYTNYTTGFADCLDYIFYQKDSLEVMQIIPFPSKEELQRHTALPSVVFPSDHIAVIADFSWK